jgi:hypothetical protein
LPDDEDAQGMQEYRRGELVFDVIDAGPVEDVRALIDASGAQRVHVVGVALYPARLKTVSALSVPHPTVFFKALATSRQAAASWYMYFFQLSRVPERFLTPTICGTRVSRWRCRPG